MDALGTELGVRGLTSELELALFAVVGALRTCFGAFVSGRAGDTCQLNTQGTQSLAHDKNSENSRVLAWMESEGKKSCALEQ